MIRQPILAGSWYPGSAEDIRAALEKYLTHDEAPQDALGVVAPHAGWVYSGAVAGKVFASVNVPDSVIVLAPNHRGLGQDRAIWDRGAWKVPTGTVEVDEALCAGLVRHAGLRPDLIAHREEHSLEIQLPFLLGRNPNVKIAPVCLMSLLAADLKEIGLGMARAIRESGKPALIVASSDMSHYIPAAEAKRLDGLAIEKMMRLDPEGLFRAVRDNDITMCGVIPAVIMLHAAKALGATRGRLVAYATSGEVTGDLDEVVAYAGMVVDRA